MNILWPFNIIIDSDTLVALAFIASGLGLSNLNLDCVVYADVNDIGIL